MLGERLQELRKDRNISQAELSEMLGVSHYTISSYECNRSDPDDNTKILIAKIFDVSIDYLLGLIDEQLSYKRNKRAIFIPESFDDKDQDDIKSFIQFLAYKKESNISN